VGASAGIFGLIGAALVLMYRPDAVKIAGGSWQARLALWTIAVAGLAASLAPGVSMAGHVGGLLPGLVAGWSVRLDRIPGGY
jgi:membrane associated rhomboid family serine protease